jgi:hypothetical protein
MGAVFCSRKAGNDPTGTCESGCASPEPQDIIAAEVAPDDLTITVLPFMMVGVNVS